MDAELLRSGNLLGAEARSAFKIKTDAGVAGNHFRYLKTVD